jgi:NADH-ubiquinone oxidoreductase chain 5
MEGPTPVSSLLHAATMVTAGVFLLVRCSNIFESSQFISFLILLFGICTALYASLVATYQYDIKKIIAYSTCSQLGYMFFACGLSFYNIAFFHLFNHAFFKALLFLGAGSIISCLFDEQDLRKMGFLILKLPFTYISIFIGSLAILGFPFLSGFYSKDLLLELTYTSYTFDGFFIYFMAIFSALFTSIYSFKLIFFVFFQKTNLHNK